MSVVSILNVDVKNNPAAFAAPYEFEITFECLEPLQKDLEWKLTYVGSATSSEHDQVLDSLLVGPVPVGVNKFTFEADAPDLTKIPNTEIIGVTVILLSCAYDDREFVRVGYYVNNEYDDETLAADPPAKPVIDKVRRNILAEKPRVTRFAIKWDSEESAPAEFPPDQPEADTAEDDEAAYAADEAEDDAEDEAALAKETAPAGADGDADMGDGEEAVAAPNGEVKDDDDAASNAGSEDLEAESSGSEDEGEDEEEEGEGEADGDEEMDMGDDGGDKQGEEAAQGGGEQIGQNHQQQQQQQQQDVMVH